MKRTRILALLLALLLLAACLVSCGGPSDLLIPPDDDDDTSSGKKPGTGDTSDGDGEGGELIELPCDVVINEVASKNDTEAAPDGGYYDWIELYNGGDETVDLSGWGLSDGKKDLRKFVFPNGTTLSSGAYLVVWADGVGNGDSSRTGLYAAFGISADGETIYLSDTEGNLRARLAVPALRKNTTYGRATDASEVFATLSPTPGQTNDGSVTLLAASV
ncbi:MAG: lamin tail domain-containing protein, partial [Eubacteriales bacterium]